MKGIWEEMKGFDIRTVFLKRHRGFKSIEEVEEYYLPEHCKEYPIKIRVNKEEAEFIERHRGTRATRK